MRRWSLLLLLALPGCIYQELTATHIEAGGVVTATLNGGGPHTSKGLGDSTKDPFSISGNSPILVFYLSSPATYTAPLAMPGMAVDLPLVSGGYVQLAVHADGSGCTADSGTLHLATDASSNLTGTFEATGFVPNTMPAVPCTLSGMLEGVPVTRE